MKKTGLSLIILLAYNACSEINYKGTVFDTKIKHPGKLQNAVVVFVSPTCPICIAQQKKIDDIIGEETPGTTLSYYMVYPYKDEMAELADYNAAFKNGNSIRPVIDSKGKIAEYLDARITPSAFLIDSTGQVVYSGAIDNKYPAIGVVRSVADSAFLLDAIVHYTMGKKIKVAQTHAVGCKFR